METTTWKPTTKISFRFVFIYFFLIAFPIISYFSTPWVAKNLLRLTGEITPSAGGSGDQTYSYIMVLIDLVIATVGCLIWSTLDWKRKNYQTLSWILRVFCRYYLSFTMILYGCAKIIKSQFPFPYLDSLLQPFGEISPMGLVWKFMGYSVAYNVFTGMGEIMGGFLLIFRRTTTLGALVVIAVMSNVVMLNFCYDVPVKLMSSHLLLIAIALLIPDFKRLVNLFILNQSVPAANLKVEIQNRFFKKARITCKAFFLIATSGLGIWASWTLYKERDLHPKPPLYGIYEVAAFEENGQLLPPLLTDDTYWRYFVVDYPGVRIRMINDKKMGYGFKVDEEEQTITLELPEGKSTFNYKVEENQLTLTGEFEGKDLVVTLKKKDTNDFPLINRGFHWINEIPLNL